jgi:hypothetical protein
VLSPKDIQKRIFDVPISFKRSFKTDSLSSLSASSEEDVANDDDDGEEEEYALSLLVVPAPAPADEEEALLLSLGVSRPSKRSLMKLKEGNMVAGELKSS